MNPQKRKGDHAEREIAGLLNDMLGIKVRRKLGAGRTDDTGDLDWDIDGTVQVKSYKDTNRAIREGLANIRQQTNNNGSNWGAVLARRPGGEWIAVMQLEDFAFLLREAFALTLDTTDEPCV